MRDKGTTYRIMSAIRAKDTKPEKLLGKSLWAYGLKYRKQYKIKGKPDFVFVSVKIAVFCDGDFWHGNNWRIRGLKSLKHELKRYSKYWKQKILRNIERDNEINIYLKQNGWRVFRFWESDVKMKVDTLSQRVKKAYDKRIVKSI